MPNTDEIPIGYISLWTGKTLPKGWVEADGRPTDIPVFVTLTPRWRRVVRTILRKPKGNLPDLRGNAIGIYIVKVGHGNT